MSSKRPDEIIKLFNREGKWFQKAKLTWKIEDYGKHYKYSSTLDETRYSSDEFMVMIPSEKPENKGTHLKFKIDLNWNHKQRGSESDRNQDNEDQPGEQKWHYIGLFLAFFPQSSSSNKVTAEFGFSIMTTDGEPWKEKGGGAELTSPPVTFSKEKYTVGWHKFAKKEDLRRDQKLLLDKEGALTVVCHLEILCDHKIKSKGVEPPKRPHDPLCLGEELLMATKSKDVSLICPKKEQQLNKKGRGTNINKPVEDGDEKDNEVIHCHKFILTVRSDVFAAMFSHENFQESQNNTIVIDDTPFNVLQEFVKYLYTDRSPLLESDLIKDIGAMLRLADKYNVVSLKQRCENRLLQMIKPETFGEIYSLAYLYSCDIATKEVVTYFMDNFDETSKPDWMDTFDQSMQDQLIKDIVNLQLQPSSKKK